MQTTQTLYDPAISGELRHPQSAFEPVDWGVDKIIARRAALELHQEDAVNLGFGISALVPRILLEEGLDGAVTWVIEQGAGGGVPLLRILKERRARKFVNDVEHVTFSGRRARELGQDVVYVTERCVLRLEREGLTVVEVAPGVDLERDVLGQAEVTLRVSPELRSMDPRLFRPARLGLHLDAASATPRAQRSNGKVAAA